MGPGTRVLGFWIKSLFLAPRTHLSIYWPVMRWAVQDWTQLQKIWQSCSFFGKISIFIHLVIHHVFESCSEPGPAELTLGDPAQTSPGPRRLSSSHALPTPFSASPRTPQVFKHTAMSSPACEPCEDLEQMQNGAQKMWWWPIIKSMSWSNTNQA